MSTKELPPRPNIEQYRKQAKDLVRTYRAAEPDALARVKVFHTDASTDNRLPLVDAQHVIAREHGFESWPKFAKHIAAVSGDPALVWRQAEEAVVAGDVVALQRLLTGHEQMFRDRQPPEYAPGGLRPDYSGGDAKAIILREHQFETWPRFEEYVADRARGSSLVAKFETAADAIVSGDTPTLERLLRENPELVHTRSTRRHKSPLLHYLGGINGGEGYRQKCPRNEVKIAELLLKAGGPVNVLGGPYGNCTVPGSVATSIQPMIAGLVEPLLETLLKHGGDINADPWSIVNGCLANGRPVAAEFLRKKADGSISRARRAWGGSIS